MVNIYLARLHVLASLLKISLFGCHVRAVRMAYLYFSSKLNNLARDECNKNELIILLRYEALNEYVLD